MTVELSRRAQRSGAHLGEPIRSPTIARGPPLWDMPDARPRDDP